MAASSHPGAELTLPLQWIEFDETLREHDRVIGRSS
jgi:hypothetical protein